MRRMALFVGLWLVMGAICLAATRQEFSVYQRDIVDRQPFGEPPPPPPAPVAKPPPPVPPPAVFRDLVLVAITDDADAGIKVGIVNRRTKKPYYMKVGDTAEDGITVVEAYPEEERVVVEHSGQRETLRLPGAAAGAAHASPPTKASGLSTAAAVRSHSRGSSSGITSYRDRLKKRREEMLAAQKKSDGERQNMMTREQFRKHLEEYQMQVIRAKGKKGKPLQIPLTKEMDEQLVKEGLLPKQE